MEEPRRTPPPILLVGYDEDVTSLPYEDDISTFRYGSLGEEGSCLRIDSVIHNGEFATFRHNQVQGPKSGALANGLNIGNNLLCNFLILFCLGKRSKKDRSNYEPLRKSAVYKYTTAFS